MRIFMDTDAVRGMAGKARQTADDLDGRIDALLSQIENMEWQSNARTEFDGNFKAIHRNVKTLANAMRLMGSAADAKASQWEAIASKLLGPFVTVQNFWQTAMDNLGLVVAIVIGIWWRRLPGRIWPKMPTVILDEPVYRFPEDSEFFRKFFPIYKKPVIDGIIQGPSWQPDRPGWLPGSGGSAGVGAWGSDGGGSSGSGEGGSSGGGAGGSGGGGYTSEPGEGAGSAGGSPAGGAAAGSPAGGAAGSPAGGGGGSPAGGGGGSPAGGGGGSPAGGGGGSPAGGGGGSPAGGGGGSTAGGGGGSPAGGGGGSPAGGGGGSTGSGSANAPTEAIPISRTPPDKLGILGGCTNYVATKRDVSGFWKPGRMNAQYWNENAAAAGFEVGNKPVAGSIMVVEADNGIDNGIMNVDDRAGHVLYVESVKETNGGYLVSYSHAGTLYNEDGSYIPGTYKMLNNSTPIFVPYESPAVSFIYDKV